MANLKPEVLSKGTTSVARADQNRATTEGLDRDSPISGSRAMCRSTVQVRALHTVSGRFGPFDELIETIWMASKRS
jgi:hypothetical protein